jgi:hypothetical protein
MISYEPLAAGRATLLAVNNTRVPIENLCFNTLSITQTTPASPVVPLRGRLETRPLYSTHAAFLTSLMRAWQIYQF